MITTFQKALSPEEFIAKFDKLPGRLKNRPPFNTSRATILAQYTAAERARRTEMTAQLFARLDKR